MKAELINIEQQAGCLPKATVFVFFEIGELKKLQKQKDYINKIKKTSISKVCEELIK